MQNPPPSSLLLFLFPFLSFLSTRACVVFQYTCGFASAYTELYGAYDRWLHIVGNFKAGDGVILVFPVNIEIIINNTL